MAIHTGFKYLNTAQEKDSPFGYKKFTLTEFSATVGLHDPQDNATEVTAKAIVSKVAGEVVLVDPFGNETTEAVLAGIPIHGPINGVKSGTTLAFVDITVIL